MIKCTFCQCEIPAGTGKLLAKNDSKILYFCSGKCEKNLLKLKRKPRKIAWTGEAQLVKKGKKN